MKNIVLCGSMKVKDKIFEVEEQLKELGYNVLMPEECLRGEPKVIASRAHFDRITNPDNEYILIVNVPIEFEKKMAHIREYCQVEGSKTQISKIAEYGTAICKYDALYRLSKLKEL